MPTIASGAPGADDGDERARLMARAREMGCAFADLNRISAVTLAQTRDQVSPWISAALVRETRVLPVKKDGINLWVAVDHPSQASLGRLHAATSFRIIPVIAVPGALDDAIARIYPE